MQGLENKDIGEKAILGLEIGKNLAFDSLVEQMLILACQKSNKITVHNFRKAS